MNFDYHETRQILATTPKTIRALVEELPERWLDADEGAGTWSPRLVVGHLIHGERTDWMERLHRILEHGASKAFDPFDRTAHVESAGRSAIGPMLDEFEALREKNLEELDGLRLAPADLDRPGLHPVLGPVTLRQLLATWVAHDYDHVVQIGRVLAKRYTEDVGPWKEFLGVLGDRMKNG